MVKVIYLILISYFYVTHGYYHLVINTEIIEWYAGVLILITHVEKLPGRPGIKGVHREMVKATNHTDEKLESSLDALFTVLAIVI